MSRGYAPWGRGLAQGTPTEGELLTADFFHCLGTDCGRSGAASFSPHMPPLCVLRAGREWLILSWKLEPIFTAVSRPSQACIILSIPATLPAEILYPGGNAVNWDTWH